MSASLINETTVVGNKAHVAKTLQVMFAARQIVELRLKQKDGKMMSGLYDDMGILATDLTTYDTSDTEAQWLTLNPIRPNPDSRPRNTLGYAITTTNNTDIESRRWLYIDLDPTRPADTSSTDAEKAAALTLAERVMGWLKEKGWPDPVLCDSGNGYHCLYAVDLPNNPHSSALLEFCLSALHDRFFTDAAHVDKGVYNASRITRGYGTFNRKGNNTPERPWRRSGLLKIPQSVDIVPPQLLEDLAAMAVSTATAKSGDRPDTEADAEDIYALCELYDLSIIGEDEKSGVTYYFLDHCPFKGDRHSGDPRKTAIVLGQSVGFKCFSDDCSAHTIGDMLRLLRQETGVKVPQDLWDRMFPPDESVEEMDFDELDEDNPWGKAAVVSADELAAMFPPAVEPEPEVVKPAPKAVKPAPVVEAEPAEAIIDLTEDLVASLAAIMFRNPKAVLSDFIPYRKRLFWATRTQTVTAQRELLFQFLLFEKNFHRLPNRVELLEYIDNDEINKGLHRKDEVLQYLQSIGQIDEGVTFDFIVAKLLKQAEYRYERDGIKKAFKAFAGDAGSKDVNALRAAIKELWAGGILAETLDSKGVIQEHVENIHQRYTERTTGALTSPLSFLTGFPTIDKVIASKEERLMAVIGPPNNMKTTVLRTLVMNLARQGKNVLFVSGEHAADYVEDVMALMHGHHLRDKFWLPRFKTWEDRKATTQDLHNLREVLEDLKHRESCPGFIDVKHISHFNNDLGEIRTYMENNHPKYEYHALVIDPFDSLMLNVATDKKWGEGGKVIQQLLDLKTTYLGGTGLIVITSFQMKKSVKADVEQLQRDNRSKLSEYEDVLVASDIEFYTAASQKFDMLWGCAGLSKNGSQGVLTCARLRYSSPGFEPFRFNVDPYSRYAFEDLPETTIPEELV